MRQFLPKTHGDVLGLWAGPAALARDMGLPFGMVRQWYDRGKIPPKWWPRLSDVAETRLQVTVSCRRLAEILAEQEGVLPSREVAA